MSHLSDSARGLTRLPGPGPEHQPGAALTRAVEDVSQHGFTQTEALEEKRRTLSSLQAALSGVSRECEAAEQELRSKDRAFLLLQGELEALEGRTNVLQGRCVAIGGENTELQIGVAEEEEKARMALERFNTYRGIMQAHRAAALQAESQTDAHKELQDKRALLRMLAQRKEELRKDLENPNGNTVHMEKSENDALKREISVRRETIAKKREQVKKEFETHSQIKKDIEIQNRRFEAILKRLCCQLSRAQAAHRQMSTDVHHLERQLAELKGQLPSS